jgi:hypothetical protein
MHGQAPPTAERLACLFRSARSLRSLRVRADDEDEPGLEMASRVCVALGMVHAELADGAPADEDAPANAPADADGRCRCRCALSELTSLHLRGAAAARMLGVGGPELAALTRLTELTLRGMYPWDSCAPGRLREVLLGLRQLRRLEVENSDWSVVEVAAALADPRRPPALPCLQHLSLECEDLADDAAAALADAFEARAPSMRLLTLKLRRLTLSDALRRLLPALAPLRGLASLDLLRAHDEHRPV